MGCVVTDRPFPNWQLFGELLADCDRIIAANGSSYQLIMMLVKAESDPRRHCALPLLIVNISSAVSLPCR